MWDEVSVLCHPHTDSCLVEQLRLFSQHVVVTVEDSRDESWSDGL